MPTKIRGLIGERRDREWRRRSWVKIEERDRDRDRDRQTDRQTEKV